MDCTKQIFIQGTASKAWLRLLIFSVGLFGITQLRAATGSDNAANYSSGWNNGDNQGTGLGNWIFENNHNPTNVYAGGYLAISTNPSNRNIGILSPDTNGIAFALYANPLGAFVTAKRNFGGSASPTPLAVGESFRVQWVQYWGGGNKGINLYFAGWDDATDKVLNLRQDGDKFLAQPRGSVNSPTAIANAFNNLTTVIVRRAAPDTLILNIQTEDPLDIPYSSTFRSPAPDRVSFYFSNGANGSNDEPLFNNLSIEADSTPVETRQIKFSVNMGSLAAQSPKGFDAAQGDKIYVRGYPSGGWDETEKVELIQEVEGIYSVVLNVAGDTGLKSGGYKFYIEKGASSTTVVVNSGYESSEEREFNLPVSNVDLPVVYFNNVSASRTITFAANMGVQISKSLFTSATHRVEVRGSFTSPTWTGGLAILADPDNDGIYTGSFTVPGNLGDTVEYKFYRTGESGADYEGLADNRTLTLGADGVNSTIATAFFNNDDGIGPVISLTGSSTLNLNVGEAYVESGATAFDAIEGTVTATPSGAVDTNSAGTYTVTYNANDANGNAATSVTRTVVVNAPGSSFNSAYPGRTLTEVAPNGLTFLANYAFGGNETTPAKLPVQDTSDPTKLRLVVVFRTDDSTLPLSALGGETTADLAGGWSASGVSVENSTDVSPVPPNSVRKVISVDRGTALKKFLRATVTK